MAGPGPTGLRERKKLQTRRRLSEVALRLFVEHGYDAVTIAQIAEAAEVSVATVFKYVPDGKEALIFDDGVERRDSLVRAVTDRPTGKPLLEALREYFSGRGPFTGDDMPAEMVPARDLILSTPELIRYQRKLWMTVEPPLADAIAAESGRPADDPTVRALTRFVLEIPDLVGADANPSASLDAVFGLLTHGWPEH